MATEYRIGNGTKSGMLALALLLDAVQFATPGYMDTLVIAFAAMTFGMIFIEKGALTSSGTGALKVFRLLVPLAEVFISHIPGITLAVWIQIKISRIADNALPDNLHDFVYAAKLKGRLRDVAKNKKFVKMRSKKIARVAYGKGKRGARTLARKAGLEPSTKTSSKRQRLQDAKVPAKKVV